MLTPDQVIPFLSSEDSLLREQATNYFHYAHDRAPLTADDCWAAVARTGIVRSDLGLLRLLRGVPHSDESTEKLLAALDEHADDELTDFFLDALEEIDFDQLRRHRDRIFARADLHDEVRASLEERLLFADAAAGELWDRLYGHADETRDEYWNEIEHGVSDRLLEALARHGQPAAELAMAMLEDPASKDDAREIYAVYLLARMRHRPALDLLVRKFVECEEDDDVMHEALQDGIPKVGGPDAVPLIEALFPDQPSTFRLYAGGIFERIKHPDSEAALLRLLDHPKVGEDAQVVANALGVLCTTDGLPQLRQIVLEEGYDASLYDLKQDLVACALMAGHDFPELPALREEVVAKHLEFRRRLDSGEFDLEGIDDLADDLNESDFEDDDDYGDYPDLPPALDDREPPVAQPIRNAEPKVGRNDPCPCGSGKKYKKCCLGEA